MKKVLIIVNDFPPPVNGGNMRVYKFAKYLLKHGWQVHVLCNAFDKEQDVSKNAKLVNELDGIKLHSTPSAFKKNIQASEVTSGPTGETKGWIGWITGLYKRISTYIVPDTQRILWAGRAVKAAEKIVQEERIYYVITSSPPHSTQLVGKALKKIYKDQIQWIADFRDMWSLSHVYDLNLSRNRSLNRNAERTVLEQADKVLFVSEGIRDRTIAQFQIPGLYQRSMVIHNGYDPDDFTQLTKTNKLPSDRFNFSYVGTMFGPQAHNRLFEGILKYLEAGNGKVMFHFAGAFDEDLHGKVATNEQVCFHPAMKHPDALNFMYSSDALMLVLTNDEEGKVAYSGKFFEYLKIGRPVLALVPDGEVARIIRDHNLGIVVNPDDERAIAEAIRLIYDQYHLTTPATLQHAQLLEQFNRENITTKLASFMEGSI